MKKKIACVLLAASLLALSLAGCGGGGNYDYGREDLSEYVSFDRSAFEAGLSSIEIEDGDFTADESVRQLKLRDKILTLLAAKLDDTDAKIKLYSGAVGERDIIYYCSYYTAEFDGEVKYFSTGLMTPDSAKKLQLGLSSNKGADAAVGSLLLGKTLDGGAYTVKTVGTAEAGKLAFISYTLEYEADGKSVKEAHKYELVTLGEGSFIAEALAGKAIGKSQGKIIEPEGEGERIYADALVNFVFDGEGYTYTDVTYTTPKTALDNVVESGADKVYDLKDKELTYHVYPLYRVEIPEINAKNLLGILTEEVAAPELACLLDKGRELDGLRDAASARLATLKELNKAHAAFESATERYAEAKRAYENGEGGVSEETLERLAGSLELTESALDEKELLYSDRKAKYKKELDAFLALDGVSAVAEEYARALYGQLLDEYNAEIRAKLAEAVFELIIGNTKVKSLPEDAVRAVYDDILAEYEYTYDNGICNSSTGETYKDRYGSFEEYLTYVTATENYEGAKELLEADARRGAERYIAIYNVAKLYGIEITEADVVAVREKPSLYWENYLLYREFAGGAYAQDVKILGSPTEQEGGSSPSSPMPMAVSASVGGSLSERVRADIQLFRIIDEFLAYEPEENPSGGYEMRFTNPLLSFEIAKNAD